MGPLCLVGALGCQPSDEPLPRQCEMNDSWPSGLVSGVHPLPFGDVESVEVSVATTGVPIPGALEQWHFHPDAPLPPNTEFRWSVIDEAGCAPSEGSFTTTEVGLAVEDPEALIGRVLGAHFTDEPALDARMFLWNPIQPALLVRFDAIEAGEATVTLAAHHPHPDASRQHACTETRQARGSWDGARLILAGERLTMPVGEAAASWASTYGYQNGFGLVHLHDWRLELVVHPDGEQVTTSTLQFEADTRDLVDYGFGDPGDGTAENFCTLTDPLLESIHAEPCVACDDGVLACSLVDAWVRRDGVLADELFEIEASQTENHLCYASCANGVDDDGDGEADVDAECDSTVWP